MSEKRKEKYKQTESRQSGVKGIYWAKDSRKWYVFVKRNGKSYYGGSHRLLDDAVAALDELKASLPPLL